MCSGTSCTPRAANCTLGTTVYGTNTTGSCAPSSGGGGSCSNNGTLSITATPNRVNPSGIPQVTLAWSAGADISAASCTVTNLDNPGTPIDSASASSCAVGNQTHVVSGITKQTTFRLACGSLTKDVVVNVIPKYEEF
ncbi:MAG: hypothetical protein AAB582_03990 [Patescibacteria group bacterium]